MKIKYCSVCNSEADRSCNKCHDLVCAQHENHCGISHEEALRRLKVAEEALETLDCHCKENGFGLHTCFRCHTLNELRSP